MTVTTKRQTTPWRSVFNTTHVLQFANHRSRMFPARGLVCGNQAHSYKLVQCYIGQKN